MDFVRRNDMKATSKWQGSNFSGYKFEQISNTVKAFRNSTSTKSDCTNGSLDMQQADMS